MAQSDFLGDMRRELDRTRQQAAETQRAFHDLGGAAAGLKLQDVAAAMKAVRAEAEKLEKEELRRAEQRMREFRMTVQATFNAVAVRAPFQAFQTAISGIQTTLVNFVRLANPAAVLRFQLALDDLQAVIGRAMVPALNQFTAVLRGIANAVAGLNGNGQRIIASIAAGTAGLIAFGAAALAVQTILTGGMLPLLSAIAGAVGGLAFVSTDLMPALRGIGEVFVSIVNQVGGMIAAGLVPVLNVITEVVQGLAPLIPPLINALFQLSPIGLILNVVGQAVNTVGPYLVAFARVVVDMGRTVYGVMRSLLSFIGVSLPEFDGAARSPTGKSEGAAVRNTSTQDVNQVLARAREQAFAGGLGAKKPEERTANGMDELNRKAAEIERDIKNFLNDLREFPARIGEAVSNALTQKFGQAPGASAAGNAIAAAAQGRSVSSGGPAPPPPPESLTDKLSRELSNLGRAIFS